MDNLEVSTDPALLGVDLPQSLNTSPSVSTFLPDEEASMCPLLSTTPSPPPMHFSHPLTPNAMDDGDVLTGEDGRAEETSSYSGSSGIGIDVQVVAGTTTVFNQNVYQHLGKNGEQVPESESKLHANLNLPDSKDVPSFVYWDWKLIRNISFYVFVAAVAAMIAIVISMIYSLPRSCNPKTSWYEGSVFYEVFPASFKDSNGDGIGDLRGLANGADYLSKLGVGGVRLNSIFPSNDYPIDYENITTLLAIDKKLGTSEDMMFLVRTFHNKNISVILDLPIYPILKSLDPAAVLAEKNEASIFGNNESIRIARSIDDQNAVIKAIDTWLKYGIDGFYVKGLEHFQSDPYLLDNIRAWKALLGPNRVLILNNRVLKTITPASAEGIIKNVDLVDIFLDVTIGTQQIAEQIKESMKGLTKPGEGPYIQWTLGGVSEHRISYNLTSNATLAATVMSLMLPGSPSIFYGDEHSLQESHDPHEEHGDTKHLHHLAPMAWQTPNTFTNLKSLSWLPSGQNASFNHFETIDDMVALRYLSPSIYKNSINKSGKIESNTVPIYIERGNILILSRWYPRRNRFVSISNFGEKKVTLDLTNYFYSGEIMIGDRKHERIYFDKFEIDPIKTIVVKLDK